MGNYEKSYNNVLFTAFIIGLPGSQCSQPPNHKQRSMLPTGSEVSARCLSWAPGLFEGQASSTTRPHVRGRAPGKLRMLSPTQKLGTVELTSTVSTSRREKR